MFLKDIEYRCASIPACQTCLKSFVPVLRMLAVSPPIQLLRSHKNWILGFLWRADTLRRFHHVVRVLHSDGGGSILVTKHEAREISYRLPHRLPPARSLVPLSLPRQAPSHSSACSKVMPAWRHTLGQFGAPKIFGAIIIGTFLCSAINIGQAITDYFACARVSQILPPPQHALNRGLSFMWTMLHV